jgi:hypothetical protein
MDQLLVRRASSLAHYSPGIPAWRIIPLDLDALAETRLRYPVGWLGGHGPTSRFEAHGASSIWRDCGRAATQAV